MQPSFNAGHHVQVDTSEDDAGIPNVSEEMGHFQWAGVGLRQEDSYRLFLAMTALKVRSGQGCVVLTALQAPLMTRHEKHGRE